MRYIELFGGIGALTEAIKNIGIKSELVDYVEIDKYAVASFNAINGTNFEPQDICMWDKDLEEIDLIMHGSPCQDFSLAGKQAGGDEGSGTRSSLMYETLRIVKKLKPKYVIWENVKNVLSKTHKHNFDKYIDIMSEIGYKNYYQVLNAKDYGVPQNRERVFTVSILEKQEYEFPTREKSKNEIKRLCNFSARNDCRVVYDKDGLSPTLVAGMGEGGGKVPMIIEKFEFPSKRELKLKLKDILEDEVEKKYYLSDEQIERIKTSSYAQNARRIQEKEYCDTLCERDWRDVKCIKVGDLDIKGHDSMKRVYSPYGISPTLTTMGGGNTEPKIITGAAMRGRYNENCKIKQQIEISNNEYSNAITTVQKDSLIYDLRIRKLTPKECWRLMGFSDESYDKAAKVNSNTQLYKQAGNSICVPILEKIIENLIKKGD